jgi:hypothetical protein
MELTKKKTNEWALILQDWTDEIRAVSGNADSGILFDNNKQAEYKKYLDFYAWASDKNLSMLFAILHMRFVDEYRAMNRRLPTGVDTNHFWANNSRDLLKAIDTVERLDKTLKDTPYNFRVDEDFENSINICKTFLKKSNGSTIPPHTEQMPIYIELPIFIPVSAVVVVESEKMMAIDVEYVRGLYARTKNDFDQGKYDSVLTKCRTLLEEVFCYAIEKKGSEPGESGKIDKLFSQVKKLYNMEQSKNIDKRVNDLVNGLNKIIDSVSSFRNIGSDAHGVGSKRLTIKDHHARLFLNSTLTIADFLMSVVAAAANTIPEERK